MVIWWIDENRLAGGPNPDPATLEILKARGFRTIVSLLDETEQRRNYGKGDAARLGLAFHSIPILDLHAPSRDQFQGFLRLVAERLETGSILVHCQGGLGRTGTMGAAYWIWKGFSAEEALARIRQVRPGAVETPDQQACLDDLERALRRA